MERTCHPSWSWIGGGANQTAMLELYQYNPSKYGAMITVDIVVANIWMALILLEQESQLKLTDGLKPILVLLIT